MAFAQHLQDEQLLDCYLAEGAGDTVDPRLAEHMADCAACTTRYAEFASFMDALKADAAAETDELFTPERLHAQQSAIAARLAAVGRVARVISFPSGFVSRHMSGPRARIAPRWIAAAAAAGLFVGVSAGQFFYGSPAARTMAPRSQSAAIPVSAPIERVVDAPAVRIPANDDAFLSELELLIQRPRTPELIAFDAMTPHAREITVQLR